MKKLILLAVLALVLMTMPAFASVQNIKVSGDIDSTWVVRDRFDFGVTNSGSYASSDQYDQNFLITQARLRVDADLTDNVSAAVSLISERPWGNEGENENENDVDINLAYVQLREMLYSPLTVYIGRQAFKYGNSFVIDSAGQNNTISANNGLTNIANDLTKRRAMDAVRLVFDYNPLAVEFLYAKVDSNNSRGLSTASFSTDDDVDLYGVNANYQLGDQWETVVEGYFFSRIDKSLAYGSGTPAGIKADTVYMPGLRASTNPIKGLNVQGEVAWQMGNKALVVSTTDNIARHAVGAQGIVNYMLPFEQTAQWSPVVTGVYTYVSGDKDPDQSAALNNLKDDYREWDPMYENQAGGKIYNALFDLGNAHIVEGSLQVKVVEDVTAKASVTGIWGDKKIGNTGVTGTKVLRLPGSNATITQVVTDDKHVGNELDGTLTYDYTEDVQFGVNAGVFWPGAFFENDSSAKQLLVNTLVKF